MREVQIYKRLPPHERLLRMIDYADEGLDSYIVFEYLRKGNLESFLASDARITYDQQLQWSLQAAEGIALLHSFGIIHADIKPQNMLLDDSMCLRVMDLSGSSINNLPPLCLESTRFFLPRPTDTAMPCSTKTDIFALGSSIYQIMQRSQPYAELASDDVERKYAQKVFPRVDDVPCGDIIMKCWTGQYTSAESVVNAIKSKLREQTPSVWSFLYKALSRMLPRSFVLALGQSLSC